MIVTLGYIRLGNLRFGHQKRNYGGIRKTWRLKYVFQNIRN